MGQINHAQNANLKIAFLYGGLFNDTVSSKITVGSVNFQGLLLQGCMSGKFCKLLDMPGVWNLSPLILEQALK